MRSPSASACFALPGVAILLLASSVHGQCEIAKLLASDGAADDGFGFSVAISGDLVIVGAPIHRDNGHWSGSGYIYRYNGTTWPEETELLASDGGANDVFGYSVAISGDLAIVGAYGDDDNGILSGSAYVYRSDGRTWIEEAKLLPSDGEPNAWFGNAAAIDGDVAIVGAPADDQNGRESGAAYIYRFDPVTSAWVEEAKLLASDGAAGDFLGNSVAIDGAVVIVGAFGREDNGTGSGAAYVYRFDPSGGPGSGWTEEAKLLDPNGAPFDNFGRSVAISGDVSIVGAPGDDDNGVQSGSAFIYRFDWGLSRWEEETKLVASHGAAGDSFGRSIAISHDVAIVGAFGDDNNGLNAGSAYLYRYDGTTWGQPVKLLASDGAPLDLFGISVAMSGDLVIVGADAHDDNGDASGSAYVFDVAACGCVADLNDDGSVGILDLLALLAAWGSDPGGPPDFDGDANVGILDLLRLVAAWGPCPCP